MMAAASSHIIKFNRISGEIPKLIENEFFMNRCGFHVGLQVIGCWLESVNKSRFLACERYYRSKQGDQEVRRIHQEDFCQVLSHPSSAKYQKEGGPGFANCGAILRRISLQDFNRMVDWLLFNYLMSNSDAHGKNLSLLYSDPYAPRLAPFYDLVCTRAYPKVDRNLAMAIGSQYDPDRVSAQNFKDLARDMGVTFHFLRDRFHLMAERLTAAMPLAKQDLRNQGVATNQMQHVFHALEKHFYKHTKVM